jgi:osmotically-inducible protein OsmY
MTMILLKPAIAALLAASMLVGAGCASTKTQESTGEYIDDTTITTKVKTAIFNEPSLKVAQINVETNRASSVARAVTGVASVKNDLRLK